MPTQPFGALFQCYKNPYATYKCLESFRKYYPDNTIVLVSDNGYDYTKMAKYFKCEYVHCKDKSAGILHNKEDIIKGVHIDYWNTYTKRTLNLISMIKEDYVMFLEDDNKINKPITDVFLYDLNGFCPNRLPKHLIKNLSSDYPILNIDNEYKFSGHGGSICRKEKLVEYLLDEKMSNSILQNWINLGMDNYPQDLFISLLIHLHGGTIGPYQGHEDCSQDLDASSHICVQHQYKKYYGVPVPEELKHLVET